MGGLAQELRALLAQTMREGLPSVAGLSTAGNQTFKRKKQRKTGQRKRKS